MGINQAVSGKVNPIKFNYYKSKVTTQKKLQFYCIILLRINLIGFN